MKRSAVSLFVRQVFLAALCLGAAAAEELPPAPATHIYDPDFLLSRKVSTGLSAGLARFQTNNQIAVYLALFTKPPQLIGETAAALNQAWNQSGYGAVIVFTPPSREARVLPSPELSLVEDADSLSRTFQDAARRALERGNYSAAAVDGTSAVMQNLLDVRARATTPKPAGLRLSRPLLLAILALFVVAGAVFLWMAARIWRSSNLFDHRYFLPEATEPAALRFGAPRCGGQMATSHFREPPAP